jgi:hypothetical protein
MQRHEAFVVPILTKYFFEKPKPQVAEQHDGRCPISFSEAIGTGINFFCGHEWCFMELKIKN